ncbi:MAG TPA: DciA family protein [Acidobacteriaceae bacterium]|nr:DciA family protein [Acidobacteriaceae bacterium]
MQPARDFIRTHLARSLSTASPEARLEAAWTAAAGRAMAARGSIAGYDAATATVRIRVADSVWLEPLTALRARLTRDLASLSGLPVRDIHLELEKKSGARR